MGSYKKSGIVFIICLCVWTVFPGWAASPDMVDVPTAGHQAIAPQPVTGLTWDSFGRGLAGIVFLLGVGYVCSKDRKNIDWVLVAKGLTVQVLLALGILYVPAVQWFFEMLGKIFLSLLDFTRAGTRFLAGDLLAVNKVGYIYLFQVLPVIIFFSALTSLLYYFRVIQRIVSGMGWGLRKLFGLSGAEGLAVAGNVFLGMCEAPLLIKRYLPSMNRASVFLVMTAGMATVSGGIMAAYIGMLGGDDPQGRLMFARYLLSASVMGAPAAVIFARMLMPQPEKVHSDARVSRESVGSNALEAVANGTMEGVKVAVSVAALLLVFVAMVALFNYLSSGLIGRYTGLNDWLFRLTDGQFGEFDFQFIIGIIFTPVAWLMGVSAQDMVQVGGLLGTKIVLNEFVAYGDLASLRAAGAFFEQKSIIIATFALCGFANIGSIGMQIGGIGPLMPAHREWISRYGISAVLGGTLASCLSATLMGMLVG